MARRKPRIFIAGLVNFNWSLDWNAKTIAKHLNKDLFDVMAMYTYNDQTGLEGLSKVKLIKRRYPDKIWLYVSYLRGILWCDLIMVYRAKEHLKFYGLIKFLRKKTLRVLGANPFGETNDKSFKGSLFKYDFVYALTNKNRADCLSLGVPVQDSILINPMDLDAFQGKYKKRNSIKRVAFIGSNFERKRIEDFIWLAEENPEISFVIMGGNQKDLSYLSNILDGKKISNLELEGVLDRESLVRILENIDLHILPSKTEGRPKVVFECGAMGIPSIVFHGYGAQEYISHGENGFIVDNREELKKCFVELVNNPKKLQYFSINVPSMVRSYDIKFTINRYEEEIIKILC